MHNIDLFASRKSLVRRLRGRRSASNYFESHASGLDLTVNWVETRSHTSIEPDEPERCLGHSVAGVAPHVSEIECGYAEAGAVRLLIKPPLLVVMTLALRPSRQASRRRLSLQNSSVLSSLSRPLSRISTVTGLGVKSPSSPPSPDNQIKSRASIGSVRQIFFFEFF